MELYPSMQLMRDLHKLDLQLTRCISRGEEAAGMPEMSGANRRILFYLMTMQKENRPVYQRDLEKALGITRSTASRVLELMERKGLVIRSTVTEDGRLKRLELSPAALTAAECMREDLEAVSQCMLEGFTPGEMAQLNEFITRLHLNLEKMTGTEAPKE